MKNILTFWLLLISVVINAQTISVTGFYKDKKSNPIEEAFVKYIYNDGLEADSTYTSITGLFTLNVNTTVGTVELSEPLFDKPFPNPFSSIVQFNVQVEKESEVLIHNLRSEQIARISIPKIGLYHISWGGLKSTGDPVSTGIYIISVVNRDKSQSHKVIYQHNGSGFGMLKAELMNNQISLKSTNAIDNIEFNKENTSFLELSLSNPTQDTSLGVITGNVGP